MGQVDQNMEDKKQIEMAHNALNPKKMNIFEFENIVFDKDKKQGQFDFDKYQNKFE